TGLPGELAEQPGILLGLGGPALAREVPHELSRHEIPQLVLADGPASLEDGLRVALDRRREVCGTRIRSREVLVRIQEFGSTGEIVASGLGDAVEDDPRELAVLRRRSQSYQLDLVDQTVVEERPRLAHLGIRDVDTIHLVCVAGFLPAAVGRLEIDPRGLI